MKSKELNHSRGRNDYAIYLIQLSSIFTRKQKTVALNIAFKIADGLCIPLEVLNGKRNNRTIENTKKLDEDTRSSKIIWKKSFTPEVQKLTQRD